MTLTARTLPPVAAATSSFGRMSSPVGLFTFSSERKRQGETRSSSFGALHCEVALHLEGVARCLLGAVCYGLGPPR
jgi:hypothetical protein